MKIAGSEVRVAGTGGVLLYEGTAEADREGNIVVAPQGKIELSAEDGERAIHNRGKEVTYYLAWEHEDLSHPSNRYRDAPQQKDYDWMKLGTHVAAGLMIAGGIAALAAGGVLLLGAAATTAIKIGMTVFLAGSLYVGEQALSDMKSGRVSDLDRYTRKAVAGSVVGFLTGASGLLMSGASLWGVLALGFGEGFVGSIVTQKLLNEDGEIDWGVAIEGGGLSLAMAGFMRNVGRSVKGVGGGSEALEGLGKTLSPDDIRYQEYWKQKELLSKSTCSDEVLYEYLYKIDSDKAINYTKTGKWSRDIQIPSNTNVLNEEWGIDWSQVPKGGYVLDVNGNPVKNPYNPQVGDVIDRYGPANGRYTSPVSGGPYDYNSRALPYVEDPEMYHQYQVVGEFKDIKSYVESCNNADLVAKIDDYVNAYYGGDYNRLVSQRGYIADGFGATGGGIQIELPMPVDMLEGIGILKEIN